ncbi:putative rna splicing factor pad-1 protein [Eutypa lata UCREL1]|uniref:Putative rna splicing factor pad-1 protein n=1 Tax=Eutypa lata (strain UCR-EL1) TaxID=1287681 RepID=M7T5C2_EUTLA|nr:putative rna splicing factor pad-1 protein [Eutypa lata UCREL1]
MVSLIPSYGDRKEIHSVLSHEVWIATNTNLFYVATVAEETEAQAEAAVIVVPIATVNENVLAAIAQMIENPLPAVKRVAIRVGEEAGAVMMIADTHAVIEVMVIITAVVGVGETVPVLAPLAETVVMITAIAMTVAILELETTTALEAAAPLGQLAARLRTKELKEFFEKVGPVNEAQIVKDRISGRSKGVGYVEFKEEESVTAALQLTGQKLLGIPVIVQLTEAEKNRQVRSTEGSGSHANSIPFHRLYVGNIHFSITEQDLQNVFEPFGELEFVQLQKDDNGRSRGYGFVQFRDADQAREALEKMNGFDLAGRPIRVGLGNDKFTPESTANLLQRFQGQNQPYQGSAFSGAGGRGPQATGFDRAGGRDNDKATGASALDDTDVSGVNFNNYSRDALMRKLARTDDAPNGGRDERQVLKPKTETKPLPVNVNMASRCVVLHNMFDPTEEEGESWIKELEDDVRQEAGEKYGHVVHISLDPNSQGDIYLKFDKVQGGENAIKGLNGRYFGGRMISAAPVVDAVYSSLFSRTKAI